MCFFRGPHSPTQGLGYGYLSVPMNTKSPIGPGMPYHASPASGSPMQESETGTDVDQDLVDPEIDRLLEASQQE